MRIMIIKMKRNITMATTFGFKSKQSFDLTSRVGSEEIPSSIQHPAQREKSKTNNWIEMTPNGGSNQQNDDVEASGGEEKFSLSKRRWVILFGVCLFGFINGLVNETSSILNVFVQLLGMSLEQYIYLSQLFLYIPLLISVPCAWLLDQFGLQVAIYASLFMSILRNLARVLLFSADLEGWHEYRLLYWLVTGVFQTFVIVIYYLLPLKVSENWFSARERPIAWTLLGVMPTVGTAIVQLIIPHFVHDTETIHPLVYLNIVGMAVSIVAVFGCVNRSQPRRPPSERSRDAKHLMIDEPIWVKLKRLLLDWNVMVQMVSGATFGSLGAAINSVMQDIFEGAGLNQVFCGQFMATMALVSFVIQMSASTSCTTTTTTTKKKKKTQMTDKMNGAVDADDDEEQRLEKATYTCKAYMIAIDCSFLFYAGTLNFHHLTGGGGGGGGFLQIIVKYQWILVMFGSIVHTALRCWSAPVFNEMNAALIAGSVSEATFGAGSTFVWCLLTNIYSVVFVGLRRTEASVSHVDFNSTAASKMALLVEEGEIGGGGGGGVMPVVMLVDEAEHMQANYLHSVLFASAVSIVATCLYVITFDGRPKRRRNAHEGGGAVHDESVEPTPTVNGPPVIGN